MPFGIPETAILAVCLLPVIVITLLGNALVAATVLTVRKLRHPPNFLLVSLALSDFCVGFVVLPLGGYQLITRKWPLGPNVCRIWASCDVLLCTSSILNLCAVSVDRYFAITKPLKYGPKRTTRRMLCYIVIVWLLAFCISVVPIFTIAPVETSNQTISGCEPNQNIGYQIYATMGAFYIPVAIMLIVNYKIYRAAKALALKDKMSHEQPNDSETATSNHGTPKFAKRESCKSLRASRDDGVDRRRNLLEKFAAKAVVFLPDSVLNTAHVRESRAARTLSIIMGVFVLCWLPFFVVALLKPIFATIWKKNSIVVPEWLDLLTLWLGYINSTLNPGLYAVFNRDFRIPFREILCCRCSNIKHVLRSETFLEIYGEQPRSFISPETNNSSITNHASFVENSWVQMKALPESTNV